MYETKEMCLRKSIGVQSYNTSVSSGIVPENPRNSYRTTNEHMR
jgi:hypothetical protein